MIRRFGNVYGCVLKIKAKNCRGCKFISIEHDFNFITQDPKTAREIAKTLLHAADWMEAKDEKA